MKAWLVFALCAVAVSATSRSLDPQTVGDNTTAAPNAVTTNQNQIFNVEYTYNNGGDDWGGLCKTGTRQSPINIESDKAKCHKWGSAHAAAYHFKPHYKHVKGATMVNNGRLQVTPPTPGGFGFAMYGGAKYNVVQFHIHTPSEHTLDGVQYAAELHIMHQKEGSTNLDDLLQVSVLFFVQANGGFRNDFLHSLGWNTLPASVGGSKTIPRTIKLWKHLKEALKGEYFAYKGSLAAPPCTESVQVLVLKNRLGITADQAQKIAAIFPKSIDFAAGRGNNRNVQPLGKRKVVLIRRPHEVLY